MDKLQIIAILGSFLLIVLIIELIRKGKLKEQYSLLWIASGMVILLFALWRDLMDIIAKWLGIFYAPSFLFLLTFIFLFLMGIYFSIVISSLSESNKRLAQEIAFLKMSQEEKQEEKSDS